MYFDTAYISKCYLNEDDSELVRMLAQSAGVLRSSQLALAEFHTVLHRNVREGRFGQDYAVHLSARFLEDVQSATWVLAPVTESQLQRTAQSVLSAPAGLFLRAADAVHLASARELGEDEIWTSDRHMLAAASYFGLVGRSV